MTRSLCSNLKLNVVRSLPSPGSLLSLQICSQSEVGERSSDLQGLYLAWLVGSLVRLAYMRAKVHCFIDMVVISVCLLLLTFLSQRKQEGSKGVPLQQAARCRLGCGTIENAKDCVCTWD